MVHKVTQREIAKRANVSPSTVSRVLGHDDVTVSAELRRAVEDAMRELQYTEKKKAAPQKKRRAAYPYRRSARQYSARCHGQHAFRHSLRRGQL